MGNLKYNLFKLSLLILFLQSLNAWFLWGQLFVVLLFSLSVAIVFALTTSDIFSLKKSNLFSVLLILIIQIYIVKDENINGLIAALFRIAILSILLLLNDEIKIDLFQFFTKALAILLPISFVAWIFFLFGFPLPHFSTNFNDGQYYFDNYYFFLLDNRFLYLPIPRFNSIFIEPGQLGMITAFLVCANRFNFRNKYVVIIFICTLFTFSLVAYVLFLISAPVFIILRSRKPVRNVILWSLFIIILYVFFTYYNNGDNIVSNFILKRLQITDTGISGNNRFTGDLDFYFQQFMKTNAKFLGIGSVKYSHMGWNGGNAGYKVFILENGIIGTLLLFLLYLSMVIYNKSKLVLLFLVIYILSFLQRAYALWDVELLIFITAVPVLSINTKNKSDAESV